MQTELPLQRMRAQHVDAVAVVVFSTVGSWWRSSSFKLVLEGNASGEKPLGNCLCTIRIPETSEAGRRQEHHSSGDELKASTQSSTLLGESGSSC